MIGEKEGRAARPWPLRHGCMRVQTWCDHGFCLVIDRLKEMKEEDR